MDDMELRRKLGEIKNLVSDKGHTLIIIMLLYLCIKSCH